MASSQVGKLAAYRPIFKLVQSFTAKSPLVLNIGSLSLFSSMPPAPLATNKKPSPANSNGRFVFPTILIPSPTHPNSRIAEGRVLKSALEDIKKKEIEGIDNLQWLLDSLRIAQIPSSTTVVPNKQQHTFQALNRNARKAKRANHGKRPCSRDRRRWKVKSWANTSRRG